MKMNEEVMVKVIDVISHYYGVDPFRKTNEPRFTECRYAIWYFLRYKIDIPYTLTAIANKFNKDHTTISAGIVRLECLLKYEKNKQVEMKGIERLLFNAFIISECNLVNVQRTLIVHNGDKIYVRKIRMAAA